MHNRRAPSQFFLLLAALFLFLSPVFAGRAAAHDLPLDVLVKMYVKPEGHTLKVLMRMPLKAVQDAEYPRKDGGYVDLAKADPFLRDAMRLGLLDNLSVFENDRKLPNPRVVSFRMSLDSDESFASYERAMAHVTGPKLAERETVFWEQALADILVEYPIQSETSDFSIHGVFDRLAQHEVTTVQFMPPGGVVRAYELEGDAGLVRLDPRWYHAAERFVVMGFWHILEGTDHLLFLLCLIIPFRRIGPLIPIITAFTVAHSITLIASAYNIAPDAGWFPPLIETLIAVSIFYMALENIVVENPARRWILTFCFGLVHGFGFSFILRNSLQFAGSHMLTSLLSFNIGVELGQLLVLAAAVPALNLLFRYAVAQRLGTIILSAIVAHQAWHWMLERLEVLQRFPWPTVTREGLLSLIHWTMAAVVMAAMLWLVSMLAARWTGAAKTDPAPHPGE